MMAPFAYPASFSPFVRTIPSWSKISHAAATFGLSLVLGGNGCDNYLTHTHPSDVSLAYFPAYGLKQRLMCGS